MGRHDPRCAQRGIMDRALALSIWATRLEVRKGSTGGYGCRPVLPVIPRVFPLSDFAVYRVTKTSCNHHLLRNRKLLLPAPRAGRTLPEALSTSGLSTFFIPGR